MSTEKFKISLDKLGQSIRRLEEALEDKTQHILIIDGTIQRFEFTYEQCWKTLRNALLSEGIETGTPRETFQKAYQAGWIQEESTWLQMLKDRNETSHTYHEEMARQIYARIPSYLKLFQECYKVLRQKR